PFTASHYAQTQIFTLASATASLCVLDWTVEGRRARGESWMAGSWRGRNEVWREFDAATASGSASGSGRGGAVPATPGSKPPGQGTRRVLMLRDSVILADGPNGVGQASLRRENVGVFGSVMLVGPVFRALGEFFIEEFGALPRIGARDWGNDADAVKGGAAGSAAVGEEGRERSRWRERRVLREKEDGVLWTAASVRGAVLVKFVAEEGQGARAWLREMWWYEGTIQREFGDGGMMSLR
ncbi:MAG: hypothetical protein LQ340_007947, partial [Diploschistes diacapsis]